MVAEKSDSFYNRLLYLSCDRNHLPWIQFSADGSCRRSGSYAALLSFLLSYAWLSASAADVGRSNYHHKLRIDLRSLLVKGFAFPNVGLPRRVDESLRRTDLSSVFPVLVFSFRNRNYICRLSGLLRIGRKPQTILPDLILESAASPKRT